MCLSRLNAGVIPARSNLAKKNFERKIIHFPGTKNAI